MGNQVTEEVVEGVTEAVAQTSADVVSEAATETAVAATKSSAPIVLIVAAGVTVVGAAIAAGVYFGRKLLQKRKAKKEAKNAKEAEVLDTEEQQSK